MASVVQVDEQRSRTDWLGILCSLGCAVHCAAMPILLSALPTLSAVKWLADPLFHQVVAVLCAIVVVLAILPGWRIHRSRAVAWLAAGGIGLLVVAAFILPDACCSGAHAHQSGGSAPGQAALTVMPVSDSSAGSCQADCVFCRRHAPEAKTISRPLFTGEQLEGRVGPVMAQRLIAWQPFLSPIGGLLLILSHLFNIRLKFSGCRCGHAGSH